MSAATCDITHEIRVIICDEHWDLYLVIRHKRYDLLWAFASVPCDIASETEGDDLCGALGSASSDITHETGDTICYGHWVLCLVISLTRQGV